MVNPPQHGVSHLMCFSYMPFPNTGPNPIHNHHLEWGLLPGHVHALTWPYVILSCDYHPVVSCHSLRSQGDARTLVLLSSDIHHIAETTRTAMEKFVVIINANKNNGCK